MSALAIVINKLVATPAITALVGSSPARVYPMEAPQDSLTPYIVVHLVAEPEDQPLTGDGQYYESRVSIECLAISGSAANTLGETVKTALRGVVKATLSGRTDVDIWKEGTDVSEISDVRALKRRLMDWYVRWR